MTERDWRLSVKQVKHPYKSENVIAVLCFLGNKVKTTPFAILQSNDIQK